MTKITYNQIEDGTAASANGINERFGKVYDKVNNLTDANLASGAVTESKIASGAVTASKIESGAVLPSKMGSTWVGKSSGKPNISTSYYTAFNRTISLSEASYIYVLWTAGGNANNAAEQPEVRILVNDVVIEDFTASNGLELYTAKLHADFPFVLSGITDTKMSGNINVKIQARAKKTNGWDLNLGFVRIDALSDGTYLG